MASRRLEADLDLPEKVSHALDLSNISVTNTRAVYVCVCVSSSLFDVLFVCWCLSKHKTSGLQS